MMEQLGLCERSKDRPQSQRQATMVACRITTACAVGTLRGKIAQGTIKSHRIVYPTTKLYATGVNKHKTRTQVRLTSVPPKVNQEQPLDPPSIPESSPTVASLLPRANIPELSPTVASLPPRATAVAQITSLPRSPLPLKYNNVPVVLQKPLVQDVIDNSAFAYNKKGQKRSVSAARQAQWRASQRIVNYIPKLEMNERSVAIRAALSNPQVREAASAVIFDASSVANRQLEQTTEIIGRATATE
jgi:hypothetical protein